MSGDAASGVTDDAALGGRLRLLQPRRGHRFGHDAILLAASVPAREGERAVDLGAGVGAAGLALAARVPGATVTLVEIDPALAALAAQNARRNGMGDRVSVATLDVGAADDAWAKTGLAAGSADHVLMNPPFNDLDRLMPSPDPARRAAYGATATTLPTWIAAAARLLRPGGSLTLIHRAEAQDRLLAALRPDFGAVALRPVHPRAGAPAIRVIVTARRGAADSLVTLPALRLNDLHGRPSREAEDVLRHAGPLVADASAIHAHVVGSDA